MANGTLAASQLEMLSQSGTGIITITPPATNTNRAITLPDAAGAIVVSGTTPSLNGITFPATQVASADANTLDDYEEGTWTPVVTPAGGSLTSYTASGQYTKVGKVVNAQGFVSINTAGTASGQLNLTMPFSAPSFGSGGSGQFLGVVRESEETGNIFFICLLNNSVNAFMQTSTNGAVTWTNGYKYTFSVTYQTA